MKMRNTLLLSAFLALFAFSVHADDRLKPYQSVNEFTTLSASSAASGDYSLVYDASANDWKKVDARASLTAFNGTVGATTPSTGAFTTLTTTSTIGSAGNVTLDDGSGASPSLTLTDGTDETAVFSKADSGFLSVTTLAADGLSVLTGNLKVGNGTPGTAQDGEDAYVEGVFEVDGTARFDGAVNVNGALTAPFEDVTATNVLTSAECGKTMTLNSATEFVSTLPAPVAGCRFKFIVKAAPASASYTIVTNASSNIIIGGINELEVDTGDDGPYDTNADTITFYDGVAAVGDWVEVISDGTSWYLTGQSNLDGGITLATAS